MEPTTIAYIGDQPEKTWKSPITQKVYFFKKYGTAKCPTAKMDDGRDIDKCLQHDNTFDLYSKVTADPQYFSKLKKRRQAKKSKREKLEKEAAAEEKRRTTGNIENVVGEIIKPYVNMINNLEDMIQGLKQDVDELKAGATQKKI